MDFSKVIKASNQRHLKQICFLCGVYGDRDIKVGHSNFHTIFKNLF